MKRLFPQFFATLLLILHFASAAKALPNPFAGRLDFFLTDTALWNLPAAELPERLKDSGYTTDAKTGGITLGAPGDMQKRNSHLFLPALAVWNVSLSQRNTLSAVAMDFLPPPALAQALTKPGFRTLTRLLEEQLNTALKTTPTVHPSDYGTGPAPYKVTCQRWVGKDIQAVLMTAVTETRTAFTAQLISLRLFPVTPPGKSPITKALTAKPDKATGMMVLEGFPPQPEWEGKHPAWALVEQALWAIGKDSDRNGILECYSYGTPWPGAFAMGLQRLIVMSGAKLTEVTPLIYTSAEITKLTKDCQAVAKKLGKNSPQHIEHLRDVDPEVLRTARTGGNSVAQYTAALKQALAAGRPLFWYGWGGLYTETPAFDGATTPVVRLIIGYAPKEGEVIFADPAGKPGIRMKLADALSASIYTVDIIK